LVMGYRKGVVSAHRLIPCPSAGFRREPHDAVEKDILSLMNRLLFLFQSTHAVIKAERLCLSARLPCKVIAVPRQISSECGIALETETVHEAGLRDLLCKNAVSFETHVLEKAQNGSTE